MAALAEEEKKQSVPNRKPFPLEIESEEEKNHPLKKYSDISERLEEIRQLHLLSRLYVARTKYNELVEYIKDNYSSEADALLEQLESHPRRKLMDEQMKETQRMMDFMTSDGDWQLYKESGPWKTEFCHDDKSDYESFRITGAGDVPLYNILAVVYEMDLIHKWMPLCKESAECGQLSLHNKCGLIRVGLFWPIQDRETVLFGYGVDHMEEGQLLIYFDSRDDNPHCNIPKCPKNRVRVDVFLGGFLFERLSANKTKVTCVWNCDPKMSVPTSIINWFAGTFASTLIGFMLDAAKFDEKSEYYRRIQEKPEFYGSIKERLDEIEALERSKRGKDSKSKKKGQSGKSGHGADPSAKEMKSADSK